MANDLLGTVEAAEALGCERSTLSRWVKEGRLTPAHKLPGRNGAFLFTRDEIERVRIAEAAALRGGDAA